MSPAAAIAITALALLWRIKKLPERILIIAAAVIRWN